VTRTHIVESERERAFLTSTIAKRPLPFQAEVGPVVRQRSVAANARLWKLHELASEVTGYDKDEMHEFALCKHFGYREEERKDLFTGEITMKRIPNERSSTKDTKKFAEFMFTTETWYGNEFGVWMPEME